MKKIQARRHHRLALVLLGGTVPAWAIPGSDAPALQNSSSDIAHDVALARETLRKSGVDAAGLPVQDAREVTWPDSSLGCGKPGAVSLQVLTHGREIEFRAADRTYTVHVAGQQAVVCDAGGRVALSRFRNLDVMIAQAQEDLAKILGVPASEINQLPPVATQWPDAGLGCAQASAGTPGAPAGGVSGFKIYLLHGGRSYTFHTDLTRVFPCPPIESR